MKKYGKYEKMPDGTRAKQPTVKSALLQTYFTSLLCLVLCVTMFFGTSYAWFTSEVNNTNNEIYIGILDVELEKRLTDGTWASLSEIENNINKTNLFDKDIRWEPGYTALETIKVINKGDLAFKYALHFTDGTITAGSDLEAVAGCFDVWVFNYRKNGNTAPAASAYADIVADESGWEYIGSLAEVLSGKAVLEEKVMQTVRDADEAIPNNPNTTDGVATEDTYSIALHMKEEADASVMGQRISLNVKLVAYQMASEKDGFGNTDYDDITYVSNEEELIDSLRTAEDGDVISIAAGEYDLTDDPLVVTKAITLQGQNPNNLPILEFITSDSGSISHGIEIKSDNVTLRNLKLEVDPTNGGSGNLVQISANGSEYFSNITIDGCVFTGSDHCIAMYGDDVTIQDCVLDESAANEQGNIIYVWGTSGKLTIRNNHFIGAAQRKHGISFYHQSAASQIAGEILIEGNTFENVYKGIVHESNMTYTDVSVKILNNTFKNCLKKPVAIDNGSFVSYIVNGNVFQGIATSNDPLLDNKVNAVINANENYWDSASPDWATVISGSNVTVENYYTDNGKTNLVRK